MPDYIAVAKYVITDYHTRTAQLNEYRRGVAEKAARKQAAVDRFNAWDGKIAEVAAE
ncbi:hypothetical protein D3C72_2399130 [compost metagenome]